MKYNELAQRYMRQVLDDKIPACKWVKQACKRQEENLSRKNFPFYFNEKRGERVCNFMSRLPHTKGKWARRDPLNPHAHKIKLEPWQCFILCTLFGWESKKDKTRRFRKASIYIPRKNGKSIFGAGIGWYMFGYDNEPGAEVYSGASTEKQALEVFKPARQMGLVVPALADFAGVTINASNMVIEGDGAKFEPVIGKPGDGASPHCAIVDEYHQHDSSELYDTMKTGMGAREQPLILIISTAGSNLAGPCREDWTKCEKILEGSFVDETQFAVIYTIDDPDQWMTEDALKMANPNWGVSVIAKNILADLETAKQAPREQANFKTKHLNLWVTSKAGFYNVQKWQSLADPSLSLEEFHGQRCFLSSDFAAKSDLTVTIYLFPRDSEHWIVFGKYYLPRATVELPQNQHYRTWALSDWLTVNDGDITDMRCIQDDVIAAQGLFSVQEWLFDPSRVYGVIQPLQDAGVPAIEVNTTAAVLSKPMRYLDDMIKAGRIHHNGDPILQWALSNVVGQRNRKDEIYPTKESPENKIDPIVALLTAFSRAMDNTGAPVGPGVMFL